MESSFTIQINAKVGAGGYGTFSWPRAVDFSKDTNVEAVYVAQSEVSSNGWLKLTSIGKQVPAGTGVIIKGTAGEIVNPETTTDEVASVTSILKPTTPIYAEDGTSTGGAVTVKSGDKIYALKTVDGTASFHIVSPNVEIPKYKAYYEPTNTTTNTAKYITFGDTATDINALDMAEEEGDIFNLGGQKVQKTTMKGVYIKNGKKVVVK